MGNLDPVGVLAVIVIVSLFSIMIGVVLYYFELLSAEVGIWIPIGIVSVIIGMFILVMQMFISDKVWRKIY